MRQFRLSLRTYLFLSSLLFTFAFLDGCSKDSAPSTSDTTEIPTDETPTDEIPTDEIPTDEIPTDTTYTVSIKYENQDLNSYADSSKMSFLKLKDMTSSNIQYEGQSSPPNSVAVVLQKNSTRTIITENGLSILPKKIATVLHSNSGHTVYNRLDKGMVVISSKKADLNYLNSDFAGTTGAHIYEYRLNIDKPVKEYNITPGAGGISYDSNIEGNVFHSGGAVNLENNYFILHLDEMTQSGDTYTLTQSTVTDVSEGALPAYDSSTDDDTNGITDSPVFPKFAKHGAFKITITKTVTGSNPSTEVKNFIIGETSEADSDDTTVATNDPDKAKQAIVEFDPELETWFAY